MTRYLAPLSFHEFCRQVAQSDAIQRPLSKHQSINHHLKIQHFCNYLIKLTSSKFHFEPIKNKKFSKCFLFQRLFHLLNCIKSFSPIKSELHADWLKIYAISARTRTACLESSGQLIRLSARLFNSLIHLESPRLFGKKSREIVTIL